MWGRTSLRVLGDVDVIGYAARRVAGDVPDRSQPCSIACPTPANFFTREDLIRHAKVQISVRVMSWSESRGLLMQSVVFRIFR